MISVIVPYQGDPPEPSALFDGAFSPGQAELVLEDCTEGTRGAGLARAASRARGDIFLFLYADSRLPAGALEVVRREIERGAQAGAFSLAYRDADFPMRWIAWWANRRSRLLRLPFGDQGLFCRRDAYEAAGGFRDLPVCDDLDLVLRLRRVGRFVVRPEATTTSSRRYRERGALRQVLRVWRVMAGYFAGVDPARLRRWYERK
jgi:GT2 family glycosyltransferase